MEELLKRIEQTHIDCHNLCTKAFNYYLTVAGNIGIFCQSHQEFTKYKEYQQQIIKYNDNPKQKYFELIEPLTIPTLNKLPEATYTHLYIRNPDPSPYGIYLGDVDFILAEDDYNFLKEKVQKGLIKGAEMYKRDGWDTFQITDKEIKSIAFVSTKKFSEKVREKFD